MVNSGIRNILCIAMGLLLLSCTGKKKSEFFKQACSQANPNCAAPTVQIGTSGSESDQSGISVGNGQNVDNAIKIKNIRYGDSTTLEFILNNSTLNPLVPQTPLSAMVEMLPGDVSFTVVAGISETSCTEGVFYYSRKCAVGLKFSPGATLPENQIIRFKFKTLTGGDFIFEAVIKPSDLLPDLYIAASELNFSSLLIYDSGQACGYTQDLNVFNYGTVNEITDMHYSLQGDSSFSIQTTAGYCSDGGTLAIRGGTCKLKICFKPVKKGDRIATLVLTGSNATVRQYTILGKGLAFEGDTDNFDFGTLVAGTANTSSQTLTYLMPTDGQSTSATSCSYSLSGSSQFSVTSNNCVLSPTAGSTCTAVIRYTAASSDQIDQGQFKSTCTQRGGSFTLNLTGVSSTRPLIADKVQIDFGEILVGAVSAATIGFQNIGSSGALTGFSTPLTVVSGTGVSVSSTTCDASLAQSGSCSVVLTFIPAQSGSVTSQFTANSNEVSLGRNITVGGQGLAISVSQTSVEFGVVVLGKDRPGPIITITNPAKATAATGCSVEASSLVAQGFTLETDSTCVSKTSLTAGESCTLIPRFTAKSPEGDHAATVVMTCALGGTANIALSGTVRNELRLVAIPPTSVNQTNRLVGITEEVEFIFENQHDTQTANSVSISTTAPASWTRITATNTTTDCSTVTNLAVGDNCGVRMRYAPSATAGSEATGTTGGTITASADSGSIEASDPTYFATAVKVTASTSTYNFGVVSTATSDAISTETIVINNPSAVDTASGCALSVSNSTDFALYNETCGATLDPSSACTFQVKAKSNGRTTSLDATGFVYYTCSIGGRASVSLAAQIKRPPVLAWSPTTLSYGTIDITLTQGGTLTLAHTGTLLDSAVSDLVVSVTGTKFSINSNACTTQLSPGASCLLGVDFYSTTEGTFTANLVASSSISNLSVTASLLGVASAARLVADTASVNFGTASVNSAKSSSVITLTNTSTIADDSNCNITTSTYYSLLNNNCGTNFSLAKAASCNFKIQLDAQPTVGTYTGNASIDCADPGPVVTIPLTTKVLDMANLSIGTTPSTDFGSQDTDAGAITRIYTITNLQGESVTFSTFVLDTGSSASFTKTGGTCTNATTLANNATCTVQIAYDPTVGTLTSSESATLVIGTEAFKADSHTDFNFSGRGSIMTLALSSGTLNFASREVGQGSYETLTTNLTNSGSRTASLSYSAISSPPFTSVGNCATSLAAGATCTLSYQFAAATAAAIHNTMLTVTEATSSKTLNLSLNARTYDVPIINIKDNLDNTNFATSIGTTYITGATIGHVLNIIDGSPSYREVTYTLKNVGSVNASSVSIGSLATLLALGSGVSGTMAINADSCTNSTLVASTGSCTFNVRYTPASYNETSSYVMATVPTISTVSAATYPTSINNIVGRSTRAVSLSLTVATLDFGPISTATNQIKSFVITNNGDQMATSLLYTVSGSAGAGIFATPVPTAVPTPAYCGTTLAGQGSCTLDVKFESSMAGAFLDSFNITGTQTGANKSVLLRGAAVSELRLNGTADYDGFEGDIASDGTRFFIVSKQYNAVQYDFGSGPIDCLEPLLNICNRDATTGAVSHSSCSKTLFSVALNNAPTYNFAGDIIGSGPRVLVSGNKIITLLQNKDSTSTHGGDHLLGGNSTLIVCDKPVGNALANGDCYQYNIHTDLSLTGYGGFGSLSIDSGKLAISSQSPSGEAMAIVVCNFDNTQANNSTLTSCVKKFITGTSSQGNHTNLYFKGTKLVVASYVVDTELRAVACDLNTSNNNLTCGSLTAVDSDKTPNNLPVGAFPTVYYDNNRIFVSYQYGSNSNIQLRLSVGTVSADGNNTIALLQKETITSIQGTGSSPRMVVSGNSTNGRLWISGCLLTPANSNANACKFEAYKCDLTNGVATCSSSPYYQQANSLGAGVIYSRSLFLDTAKRILIAPFTYTNGSYQSVNAILNLGLLPEL
jgi:hypothetical protein